MIKAIIFRFYLLLLPFSLLAKTLEENPVVSKHSITINNTPIEYQTAAGSYITQSKSGHKAKVYFVSYFKTGEDAKERPITFCFNGGPGASSTFLQLGGIGPKKAALDINDASKRFKIQDNDLSILDLTDLVFIDPVSTGYSHALDKKKEKLFHGVERDIDILSEFIRLFLIKNDRFASPKYLLGASYGAYRVIGLLLNLEKRKILCQGVILISPALDLNLINLGDEEDLTYIFSLPTYAAIASYHGKIQENDLSHLLEKAEYFSKTTYLTTLFQGNNVQKKDKLETLKKLNEFTSLDISLIKKSNLRIAPSVFTKQLLASQNKLVGRFDGRITGSSYLNLKPWSEYDPSFSSIVTTLNSAYHVFAKNTLRFEIEEEYRILANVFPWKGFSQGEIAPSFRDDIARLMSIYPFFKMFVASGIYDLATPYFGTSYYLSHLNVPLRPVYPIEHHIYPAGHMLYMDKAVLPDLKRDLTNYFQLVR
ncbi:S10 family peptidase [Criblamydia sequanensis]|uniref:Carboxypeptidase n=1 Tax=Candidatus Criblamydia sequanensis CRIB-18 TaxID=1437425 RepID=A0A090DVV6_9BACT|nr:hypothetical protein [Criblamydia sequanensis]CDR33084.1 putative carboxypeptidase [Criblamydia sequanensis CRIB-18]